MSDDKVVELTGQRKPVIPEFITPSDIDAMDDDQLDAMVSAIRTRRLRSYHIYKQTKEEKNALAQSKIRDKIDRKCEQIIKTIDASNKALDKLEKQISELRGLRLQANMELI